MEFEHSANKLDLRFIGDDWEAKFEVRDRASSTPANYKAPTFFTQAVQHSNVKDNWDENPKYRTEFFRNACTADGDIDEDELKQYIASEDSEEGSEAVVEASDEDADGQKAVLKKKARSPFESLLKELKTEAKDAMGEDVQVRFASALSSNVGERMLAAREERQKREQETVFEKQQRKKKERKKSKRSRIERDKGDSLFDDDEVDESALAFAKEQAPDLFQGAHDPLAPPKRKKKKYRLRGHSSETAKAHRG
eukprot:TRINITY_DN2399_c0_g1_i1.p1 TRINITY_DN2399_c0_g1~~TRINITY_DN2399_c0_g1_i1.p1  ORF type:complete len:252 (+),score=81.49 TRINITY_DN2399_c0_g1_i1:449-1204(+)